MEEGGRLRILRQNHVGDGLLLARDKEDGMSEHIFFQGNPSGKADNAPSELTVLSVLCELLGKVDALERRISAIERKLNHKKVDE